MTDQNGNDAGSHWEDEIGSNQPGPWKLERPGWDPALAMKTIRNTMNELFADIFFHAGNPPYELPWKPAIDLYSSGDSLRIDVELPGTGRDNIQIHATDELVVIQGCMEGPSQAPGTQFFARERRVSDFSRAIPLPFKVDHNRVKARLKNGLLQVEIPIKTEKPGEPVKIEIE
jgi:HSP20 family protein